VRKILVTITSTPRANWQEKIEEIDRLKIKEAAFFPTCLKLEERQKAYRLLEKTKLKKIPFVHLRSDMKPFEVEFLKKRYKTEIFNCHPESEHPLSKALWPYRKEIYIENTKSFLPEEEISKFAGICLDFSHLESVKFFAPKVYKQNLEVIKKFPIGCNHISCFKGKSKFLPVKFLQSFGSHFLNSLKDLSYLKNFPKEFFSDFIAIELENSLKKQLEIKKYLHSITLE